MLFRFFIVLRGTKNRFFLHFLIKRTSQWSASGQPGQRRRLFFFEIFYKLAKLQYKTTRNRTFLTPDPNPNHTVVW